MDNKEIQNRRQNLTNSINCAKQDIIAWQQELRSLCNVCPHNGKKVFEQSASGNESWHICSICGAEL